MRRSVSTRRCSNPESVIAVRSSVSPEPGTLVSAGHGNGRAGRRHQESAHLQQAAFVARFAGPDGSGSGLSPCLPWNRHRHMARPTPPSNARTQERGIGSGLPFPLSSHTLPTSSLLRVEFPDAARQITLRGDRREIIYLEREARPALLGSGLAVSDSGAHSRPGKKRGLTPKTCGVMGNRCVDSSARHPAARCSGLTHHRSRSICPRFGSRDGKAQS